MSTRGGDVSGRRGGQIQRQSLITRAVNSVFSFVRLAEFEILFFVFFVIAFLKFKDLVRLDVVVESSRRDFGYVYGLFMLNAYGVPTGTADVKKLNRGTWKTIMISRPEYNQIFVKKPIDDSNPWPY